MTTMMSRSGATGGGESEAVGSILLVKEGLQKRGERLNC